MVYRKIKEKEGKNCTHNATKKGCCMELLEYHQPRFGLYGAKEKKWEAIYTTFSCMMRVQEKMLC